MRTCGGKGLTGLIAIPVHEQCRTGANHEPLARNNGMDENGKEKTLSRQSPGKATSFDDTSCGQNFFERVAQWLDSNDLEYSEYPDRQFFSMRYAGDSGDWRVVVDVGVGANGPRLLIYSIYPVRVPEGRRPAMAELVTRINWGLPVGGFEMDWSDGEIRIRTSMPLEEGDFADKQLGHLFYGNLALANRYLAGIYGVAFGDVSPEMAMEMAQVPEKENLQ